MLLVHGIGADRRCWAPVLPALAARHRVLLVDLPGHGDSVGLAPDDDAIGRRVGTGCRSGAARAGPPTAHVVGNSLGGWVGLELAADGAPRA